MIDVRAAALRRGAALILVRPKVLCGASGDVH
jgi:hypothetical protein